MPTVKDKVTGEVVSQQPYTPQGTQRAKQIAESDLNWELDYAPNGKTDGAQRSERMYAGGGKTGYNAIGNEMYKKGGTVEEDRMILKDEIAHQEKEKGKDWDKKLTSEDIMSDKADTSTMKGRRELRKEKRKTRKRIRKSKRGTIKDIRKSDTLSNSEKRKLIKEERKRKRKAIKSINRISSFTGE